jgi:hypothetical protein
MGCVRNAHAQAGYLKWVRKSAPNRKRKQASAGSGPAHPSLPMHALHSWGAMPGCQAASQRRSKDRHAPVEHAAVVNAARTLCVEGYVSVGWLNERVCEQLDTLVPQARTALPGGKTGVGELSGYRWQGLPGPCTRSPAPCSHLFRRLFIFWGRGRACCALGVPWDVERALEAQCVCGGTRPFFPFFFFRPRALLPLSGLACLVCERPLGAGSALRLVFALRVPLASLLAPVHPYP